MPNKNLFSTKAAREDSSRAALEKERRKQAQQTNTIETTTTGMYAGQKPKGTSGNLSNNSTLNQLPLEERKQVFSLKNKQGLSYAQEEETRKENAGSWRYPTITREKDRVPQMVDEIHFHGGFYPSARYQPSYVYPVKNRMPQMVDELQFNGAKRPGSTAPQVDTRPYNVDEEQRFGPIDQVEPDYANMSYEEAAKVIQAEMEEASRIEGVNDDYLSYLRGENAAALDALVGRRGKFDATELEQIRAYASFLQKMIDWVEPRANPSELEIGEQWDTWMGRLIEAAGEEDTLNRLFELEEMIEFDRQMENLNEENFDFYREPTETEIQIDKLKKKINAIDKELTLIFGFELSDEETRELEKERDLLDQELKKLEQKQEEEEWEAEEQAHWKEREYETLKQLLITQYGEDTLKNWMYYWKRKQNAEQTKASMDDYERASYKNPYAMLIANSFFNSMSGIGYLGLVGQKIRKDFTGKPIDIYGDSNRLYWLQKAMEEGVQKRFDEGLQQRLDVDSLPANIQYFPYELLREIVNGGIKPLFGLGAIPAGTLELATEEAMGALENGATIEEGLRSGAVKAGSDAVLELIGGAKWMDDWIDPKNRKVSKSVTGNLLDAGFDGTFLGDKSEFRARVKDYEEEGYSTAQAKLKVLGDYIRENATSDIAEWVLNLFPKSR